MQLKWQLLVPHCSSCGLAIKNEEAISFYTLRLLRCIIYIVTAVEKMKKSKEPSMQTAKQTTFNVLRVSLDI